jgi:hypothetical protein
MQPRKTWTPLVLVVAIAIAAGSLTSLSSAAAPAFLWTKDGKSGRARFAHKGDKFIVCDEARDKHSVVARYTYSNIGQTVTGHAVNYKGRKSGCITDVENGPEGQDFEYNVCLADHGVPGGKRMKIIEKTCGETRRGTF